MISAQEIIDRAVIDLNNGTLKDLSPLVGVFKHAGKLLDLKDHFLLLPLYTVKKAPETTLQCARQLAKSFGIAENNILLGGMCHNMNQLVTLPQHVQKERFNSTVLRPLLMHCTIRDKIIDKKSCDSVNLKTFSNGNTLMLINAYTTAEGSRGASGVSALWYDEAQDLDPSLLSIIDSTQDAVIKYGFKVNTGTAKTSDTYLADRYSNSSQGRVCIKCDHCNHYNIAAPDQHIFKMIGRSGLICYHCGKLLDPFKAFHVHAYPSRLGIHNGYHIPQIVMPFHACYPHKWARILDKQQSWTKLRFYNEVLGIECDDMVKLITVEELCKARNSLNNSLDDAIRARRDYNLCCVGVDWSGGGGNGLSRTAVTAIARHMSSASADTLFTTKLPMGLSNEEEADYVAMVCSKLNADFLAHDYGGAGYVRESLLIGRHPYLISKMYPVTYGYRPNAQLVSYLEGPNRRTYMLDKTRSLLLTMTAIKQGFLTLPMFDAKDNTSPQMDFMAIVERVKEQLRGSAIYLLERMASRSDDAAHSTNIAYIALCDITNTYPTFTVDSRYIMTEEQAYNLYGPEE